MQSTAFGMRDPDVASEDFDGEYVVLDLASGKYFSLLEGAAVVWRGILAGHTLETLCAELPRDDPRRSDVAQLIDALLEHHLIVPTDPATEPPKEIAAQLASRPGPFQVDMFDDLADLLVADPIHDVDPETGWPVMPTSES